MTVAMPSDRAFDLKSRTRIGVLRLCSAIDVVGGILFTIAAVGLWIGVVVTAVGRGQVSDVLGWAFLATAAGPLITWAGLMMMFSRVVVTRTHLTSGRSLRVRRRVPRDSIIAIDVRQKNFGRAPRSVAVAALRDGSQLYLMPISILITRLGAESQLAMQHAVVTELRQALGVSGTDLDLADVQWPAGAQPAA